MKNNRIGVDLDPVTLKHLLSRYDNNKRKIRKVLSRILNKSIHIEYLCPVCKTGRFKILVRSAYFSECSFCGSAGVVLPEKTKPKTRDMKVYKFKSIRFAISLNKNGEIKLKSFLRAYNRNHKPV